MQVSNCYELSIAVFAIGLAAQSNEGAGNWHDSMGCRIAINEGRYWSTAQLGSPFCVAFRRSLLHVGATRSAMIAGPSTCRTEIQRAGGAACGAAVDVKNRHT
jgi:hypothetical protein